MSSSLRSNILRAVERGTELVVDRVHDDVQGGGTGKIGQGVSSI